MSKDNFIARRAVGRIALGDARLGRIDRDKDVPGSGILTPGIEGQLAQILAVPIAELLRCQEERILGSWFPELDIHTKSPCVGVKPRSGVTP
ncbi:hypothetical protein [Pengzhenrongella frigida]|uniref:hypothetical protein n=1 Tax=Pengzhenrongella frigida TaxID=1259133 RepID=UPI001F5DC145|nr:hypothetical protein [Cellulomonas sp. HLT2-17]